LVFTISRRYPLWTLQNMNKPKPPTYDFDKAIFASAVDRLSIAQGQNKEASGHDALVSAYIDRSPWFIRKLGSVYISAELNDCPPR
jgi:hypothetical protein